MSGSEGDLNTWLLVASSWLWTPLSQGQALVCSITALEQCIAQVPKHVAHKVPNTLSQAQQALGGRGALVYPFDDASIEGLVLLSESAIPTQVSAYWNEQTYSLPLKQQYELTLWHELGHIEIGKLQPQQAPWSAYQHEWLADVYLVWRLALERRDEALAWQQYHRRNLALMTDVAAMSHWSSPILWQLFQRYTWSELGEFSDFQSLFNDFYPHCHQYSKDELAEYASLVGRTFGRGRTFSLPNYMFWRRPALGQYLQPTLSTMMGERVANDWLLEHQMYTSE
ncbi:hypothetical protein [Shewanella waksmanii]|uniref:hypothetical protein n=1 Tax=Shewanella waksmanii TaxID=213783 RepID=UPI003735B908